MGMLLDAVKAFLEADDWNYHTEGDDRLLMQFGGKNGQWPCMAYVRESAGQVLFYSMAPVNVQPAHYAAITEFVARANYGMHIGSFDFDLSDGSLHYRTSIDVESDEDKLTPTLIKHLLYHNVLTMDRYLPGLRAVVDHGQSAQAAVEAIEGVG